MAAHARVLGAERNREGLPVEVVGVFDDDRNGVQDEHQSWHGPFQVCSDGLLEALDIADGIGRRNAKLIDKLQNGPGRHAPAFYTDEGIESLCVG